MFLFIKIFTFIIADEILLRIFLKILPVYIYSSLVAFQEAAYRISVILG